MRLNGRSKAIHKPLNAFGKVFKGCLKAFEGLLKSFQRFFNVIQNRVFLSWFEEVPEGPGKSQKEGQEDQGILG